MLFPDSALGLKADIVIRTRHAGYAPGQPAL